MSRAYTVGSKSHTQTGGRGARVNAQKKPASTRTDVGIKNREPQAGGSATSTSKSSPKPKCLCSKSGRPTIATPKPRVVTLADLGAKKKDNSSGSASKSKLGQSYRTAGVGSRQQSIGKGCQPPKTTPNKSSKMWDDDDDDVTRANPSLRPQQGGRSIVGGNLSNNRNTSGNLYGSNQAASDAQPSGDDRRETYQSQGGYTRVMPDPKKRDKLQSQRTSELERLEAYREKQKLGHVSIRPSRVGGAKVSQAEARMQQQKEQQDKKYEMIRKREQWAKEKKEREEQEFAEKKAKARQQTEKNKQKEQERQREQQRERQDWIARGGLERFQVSGMGGASEASEFDEGVGGVINENDVGNLMELFPFKKPAVLCQLLQAAKGDVNTVIDWLQD